MKPHSRKLLLYCALVFFGLLFIALLPSQGDMSAQSDTPVTSGVFRGTLPVIHFDVSPPLRDIEPVEHNFRSGIEILDDGNTGLEGPLGPQDIDQLVQSSVSPNVIPTPIVSFDGPPNISGVQPPDPNGDVGPNHVVVMSNLSFQILDKTGNSLYGPALNNTLWAGFGGDCQNENAGDPIVLHDQFHDRWILTQFTSPSAAPYYNCVAVSTTSDPTGTYYRWAFSTGNNFPDYPKYGVWSDGLYISTREFLNGGSFSGIGAYAVDITQLINGNPNPTYISFLVPPGGTAYNIGDGLLPADVDGSNLPPAGSPAFFMGSMDNGGPYGAPQDALTLWEFDADFSTPGNSTFTLEHTIPIAGYDTIFPCSPGSRDCIPQPGTSQKIDILSYRQRPIWRLAYRNFGTYETMVTNQSVDVSGIAGNRWWEIRDPGGTPFIYQEGTYAPGATDGIHRWMGSIAMDNSGNIAFAYSASDATSTFPSVWYTGRLAGDPLGQMTLGEESIIDGTGSQTSGARWGDYSSLTVDPEDDCTFWAVNEWLPVSGGNWTLRIGAFKFDECGSPYTVEVTPTEAAACILSTDELDYTALVGQNVVFTDPVTLSTGSLPPNVSAGFVPNPIIPANPPAESTLTLSGLSGSTAGTYSLDVVGSIPTRTVTATVQLSLYDALAATATLLTPTNGATDVSPAPVFEWTAVAGAQAYDLEIATDSGFTDVVYSATGITDTVHALATPLDQLHTYYWHVRPTNLCGEGSYSSTFSFSTRDVPGVMLVDDDDNSPNVRNYYTVALDALGYEYDVWNTNQADDEPTATDLAPYQAVIWFSGDQTSGSAGPSATSEAALATWLDNTQGCFFLSSQDYFQDRGLTSFMTDYLGTGTLTEGNGDYGEVTGQGVFSSLGDLVLLYTFSDSADWITPDGTASLGMIGTNDRGAALTKEEGYQTTFWVFPLEALYGVPNRRAAVEAFLTWCSITDPNGVLEGTVTAQATGDPIANAAVSVDGPTQLATTTNGSGFYQLELPNGTYTVSVSASGYATATLTNVSVLTGTTTTLDVALEEYAYGVALSPDQSGTTPAGTTLQYTVQITNTGNVADTFALTLAGHTFTTTLSTPSLTLEAGASTTFTVDVTVPAEQADGEIDTVTVTATSQGEPGTSASTTLTTTVGAELYHLFLPSIFK